MLSNIDILKAIENQEIQITPFHEGHLSPASYDLSLGHLVRKMVLKEQPLDLCNLMEPYSYEVDITEGSIILEPGECMLATTQECITLGPGHAGQVRSKSSLGRLFQASDGTGAGFVDPNWTGEITLEIINFMNRPVIYHHRQLICQMTFETMDTPVQIGYEVTGQYNQQTGPTESRSIKFSKTTLETL